MKYWKKTFHGFSVKQEFEEKIKFTDYRIIPNPKEQKITSK